MTPRKIKCRARSCKQPFARQNSLQIVCSMACAIEYSKDLAAKKSAKDYRDRRAAMKTRAQWLREAQAAFNAYIRERDKQLPCISCGRYHDGAYDAGHYRTVGAAPNLRFNEDNCHRQCVPCNQHKSGNVVEYRIRLVRRIGIARVEALESNNEPAHYSIDDAKRIKLEYVTKLKELRFSVSDLVNVVCAKGGA